MKSLLLFLAGLLVGANLVYFLLHRDCRAPAAPVPAEATAQQAIPPASAEMQPTLPSRPASSPPAAGAGAQVVTALSASPATAPGSPPGGLLLPVSGIRPGQLTDTFNDTRDGTRRHEALDIMAARGTPVLAASDGKVAKLFTSVAGGLTIYEFDPTQAWAYYYAHLDRYAPGLAEGSVLHRGDLIGYVGSTGNASADAPHLHFAIFVLGPEKQWWKGTAIDPYPLLANAQ